MSPRLALPLPRPAGQMRITQRFGANPEAYARFGMKGHNGLDFAADDGEPVLAVDDGEVLEVRFDPAGYGVTVRLDHSWGESRYAHGRRYSVPIDFVLGHVVRRGERVLLAGSTGNSTGPHLHLGVRMRTAGGSLDYSNANGFWGYEDPLPCLREALQLPGEAAGSASNADSPPQAARGRKPAAA